MSDNETQADIAVEMRTYFQTQKRNGNPEHRPWHQVLSDWADRIEAAAEREREMAKGLSKKLDENRAISNAAALRKALEDTEELLEHFAKPGTMLHSAFFLHMRDNRAALAAPPRNCDRFSSGEEAWIAFERERPNWCDEHSSKDPDCTDCEMADCGRCMAEWLLGTEGGAE